MQQIEIEKNNTLDRLLSVSKEKLEEYSNVLNGDPIEELLLWSDNSKELQIRQLFENFSKLIKDLSSNWSKVMKSQLEVGNLIGLSDSEFYLKETYIDLEGFHEKLPFVKREKLSEIVDFPDFSKILANIESLNFVTGAAKSYGFVLNHLLSYLKDGFSDQLNSKIESICEVKIKGWKEIKKFTSIVIYVNALIQVNSLLDRSYRDLNAYFLRQHIIIENGQSIRLDLIRLSQKLPELK